MGLRSSRGSTGILRPWCERALVDVPEARLGERVAQDPPELRVARRLLGGVCAAVLLLWVAGGWVSGAFYAPLQLVGVADRGQELLGLGLVGLGLSRRRQPN